MTVLGDDKAHHLNQAMSSSDMTMIEAIIFDLGGVILNIDYAQTIEMLSLQTGSSFADLYTQHQQDILFDRFEMGTITTEEFRDGLRHMLRADLSDSQIDAAWNAMLLDLPPIRVELLQSVATQKRIFLLSNTNEIHKQAFDQIVQATFGDRLTDLSQLFERAYYSHLVGDRKPNVSIFKRILLENRLSPNQTLFIDDTLRHIEGAKQAGLQTLHLTDGQTIENLDVLHI